MAVFKQNGAVELYYDNELVFQTTATGIRVDNTNGNGELRVRGSEGNGAQIYMDADDADDNADQWRIDVAASDNSFGIQNYASGSWEKNIECNGNGNVELYYDNSKKFETLTNGAYIATRLSVKEITRTDDVGSYGTMGGFHFSTNSVLPMNSSGTVIDDSISLGSSSYRFKDIFTTDLQLSNKGKTNDVDGTWGDYTIQEGESDLFLINNRSGKKYKFMLQEVS